MRPKLPSAGIATSVLPFPLLLLLAVVAEEPMVAVGSQEVVLTAVQVTEKASWDDCASRALAMMMMMMMMMAVEVEGLTAVELMEAQETVWLLSNVAVTLTVWTVVEAMAVVCLVLRAAGAEVSLPLMRAAGDAVVVVVVVVLKQVGMKEMSMVVVMVVVVVVVSRLGAGAWQEESPWAV